jgi:hypothetical protein
VNGLDEQPHLTYATDVLGCQTLQIQFLTLKLKYSMVFKGVVRSVVIISNVRILRQDP